MIKKYIFVLKRNQYSTLSSFNFKRINRSGRTKSIIICQKFLSKGCYLRAILIVIMVKRHAHFLLELFCQKKTKSNFSPCLIVQRLKWHKAHRLTTYSHSTGYPKRVNVTNCQPSEERMSAFFANICPLSPFYQQSAL